MTTAPSVTAFATGTSRASIPLKPRVSSVSAASRVGESHSPTLDAAETELTRGLSGMLARDVPVANAVTDGAVVIGTPASSPAIAGLKLPLRAAGAEGYLMRSTALGGHAVTV